MFKAPCETLEANMLKVGHHGSQTSSGKDFVAAVNPKTAIISVGRRNKFGHPSLRVIRRLERAGIIILRTDQLGDIVID
jgi:beta-lactamase superfamily II metal-dependent hydrolase